MEKAEALKEYTDGFTAGKNMALQKRYWDSKINGYNIRSEYVSITPRGSYWECGYAEGILSGLSK